MELTNQEGPQTSTMANSGRGPWRSIVIRWILANLLPQVFLVAASLIYLSVHEVTAAELYVVVHFTGLPGPVWLAIAAVYIVMMVWMRGAVLRPLVPRFSIPAWIAAAVLSGLVVLTLTVSGSLIGIPVAQGLALSGRALAPTPVGLPLPVFMVFVILAAEIMGGVLGIMPGLLIGAVEALVVGRSTRSMGPWILSTTAGWSMIFALIMLHIVLIVLYPSLSPTTLNVIAAVMPILFGLTAALGTLPAISKLARGEVAAG